MIMLTPIDFDGELQGRTIEVDGVASNWVLPPKMQTIELITTQSAPQSKLRIGRILPQRARSCGHPSRSRKA
jgi:hypothetical protein